MRTTYLLVLSLLVVGCSSMGQKSYVATGDVDPVLHAIYINRYGELTSPVAKDVPAPENKEISHDKTSDAIASDELYADRIIKNFKEIRSRDGRIPLSLTIFIQGGLNQGDNSWSRSDMFTVAMLAEHQYPVFVGWDSGAYTTYFDHMFRIRQGERRPAQAIATSPFVFLEDLLRSLAHLPAAWYNIFHDPIEVTKTYTSSEEHAYLDRIKHGNDLDFHISNDPPFKGVGQSYWSILNPVKLITAPVVDGLGTGAWESMLRRTDLILSKPSAFEGKIPKDQEDYAKTVLTRFLEKWQQDKELQNVKITLIGHSMGTIVVNNIVARHANLNIENVVFMGAASRIKDVENGLVPWLRREGAASLFYNISLDPYREISENVMYDFLPRGSLLHWIDNIFGQVNSFKDRTAGSWWNIIRTASDVFPNDTRNRVYLTRVPIGGSEMGPQRHGEFDDYCFWRKSFWTRKDSNSQIFNPLPFPRCIAEQVSDR